MGVAMRSRASLIAAFAISVVAVLMVADMWLAERAERLYGEARQVASGKASHTDMRRFVQKGWIIVRAGHVPADLCNTFTGGLWLSVLLPRSRHIQIEHPTVSAAGGGCSLHSTNTLIFTFSERPKPP
jgi:hypothetical protein